MTCPRSLDLWDGGDWVQVQLSWTPSSHLPPGRVGRGCIEGREHRNRKHKLGQDSREQLHEGCQGSSEGERGSRRTLPAHCTEGLSGTSPSSVGHHPTEIACFKEAQLGKTAISICLPKSEGERRKHREESTKGQEQPVWSKAPRWSGQESSVEPLPCPKCNQLEIFL